MKKKKSWSEKLAASTKYEVKPAPIDIAGMKAGQMMLVPSARMVDEFIKNIQRGTSMDIRAVRRMLALQFGAEVTCPITTGFHLRTVAEAAYESYKNGAKLNRITPFWRVLDQNTPTSSKLACGVAFIKRMRAREGLDV